MPDDHKVLTTLPEVRRAVPSFLIPDSFEAIEKIAAKFCAAGWVPKSYLGKDGQPNQAAVEVGIIAGMSVGITNPLACLTSIAVVNGTPSLWGDGMMAVIVDSGLLEDMQETLEKAEGEDKLAATCTVKRKGGRTVTQRFTWAMAQKAGLLNKQGPWQAYPSRMLAMRARSWALRDAFADVLKGMHSAEELIDAGDLVLQEDGSYGVGEPPRRPRREDFETTPAIGQDEEIPRRSRAEILDELERKKAAGDDLEEMIDVGRAEPLILRPVDFGDEDQPWEYPLDDAERFVEDVYGDLMEAASRGREAFDQQWDRHSPQFHRLPAELAQKARAIAEEAGPIADEIDRKAANAKAADASAKPAAAAPAPETAAPAPDRKPAPAKKADQPDAKGKSLF